MFRCPGWSVLDFGHPGQRGATVDAGLEQPIANWAKRMEYVSVVVEKGIASRVCTRRPSLRLYRISLTFSVALRGHLTREK